MSYQVLARKWRPQRFADVVGQGHILTALTNGLKENRLHHAYLFSGTRGVGKTSIARLFAKGLDCELGVSADPCGKCANCRAIEEGRFIDLIEIDAASRTKVEDTRELLDNVQYKPVQGRYKVYLIDEVHMLSRHSFNALLKTLEEPPEYVKFLLATTEPQKLPITILSRCMQFHLKALDQGQISAHLAHILQQEKIPFENAALERIAKAAQGSIRDSLSLTDQAIAMSNANISLAVVNQMLGLIDEHQPIEIIHALHQGNGEKLMSAVQQVAEKGGDWQQLLIEVADIFHQIAMQQLLSQPDLAEDHHIAHFAKYIAPEDVQFFYQILLNGRKELAFAPEPRAGVEMILLRALAFHPKFIRPAQSANLTPVSAEVVPAVTASNTTKAVPVLSNLPRAKAPVSNNAETVQATPKSSNSMLEELQRLRASAASADKNSEKKKPNPVTPPAPPAPEKTAKKTGALSVVSIPPKDPQSQQTSPTLMAEQAEQELPAPKENPSAPQINFSESDKENLEVENAEIDNLEEENLSAESYRWAWKNPELAQQEVLLRPSDLKQAILHNPPELVEKVIRMAEQQDPWAKTIGQLNLARLSKILALNSFIMEQTDERLHLGLRSKHQHLNTEAQSNNLQQMLAEYYQQPLQLQIEINDEPSQITPYELRGKIYQQLSQQARQQLEQDEAVQQLLQEFDAQIDEDFVRPV